MSSFRPGEETSLLVSRRGQVISLDIKLDTAISGKFDIQLRAGYKAVQIRRLKSWLGQNKP